jgi:acid phosphatase (class A)
MRRLAAALGLTGLLLAGGVGIAHAQPAPAKAPAVSRFLQPGELDPTLILPPPPKDDAPAAVEGRAELHRIAATARTPERLVQARRDDEVEDVRSIADVLGPAFDLGRFPATAKLFADLRNEDSVAAKQAKAIFKRDGPG